MKKSGFIALALMLAFSLVACGEGKTIIQTAGSNGTNTAVTVNTGSTVTGTDVSVVDDGLLVAKSEAPFDFCTKYSKDYSYKWDEDCGIVIYPQTSGSIPYVMVWRSFDNKSTAEDIHASDLSNLYYEYGNAVLSSTEPTPYMIAGVSLSGVEYQYMVGDYKVTMLRLIDGSPGTGYVLYTAKYLDDSKNVTLDALEVAISSFRIGKNAYESAGNAGITLEIVPSATKNIQYEQKVEGWFSMDIPKGWVIEADSFDLTPAAFVIHIYDSDNPDRQLFTSIQMLYFDTQASHDKLSSYPLAGSAFKGLPCMLGAKDPIVEMFQNFSSFKNSKYGMCMNLSDMNDWTEIERMGTTPLGGELIRGSYTNNKGIEIEGIFSGKWVSGLKMYGYTYPGVVYSPMFFTAPADEFNEWEEILNHCLCSLKYSQSYIDQYYEGEKATMRTFEANTQIYNEMSDMITESWDARQKTYDTISAKQSDATLGYDRVYNTETGEVYRVTTGFMDNYTGTLYSTIDDSMYLLPIAGYIYY